MVVFSMKLQWNLIGKFMTVPSFLLQYSQPCKENFSMWFQVNQLDTRSGKIVVQPARSGSTIGVTVAYGVDDSWGKAHQIIASYMGMQVF